MEIFAFDVDGTLAIYDKPLMPLEKELISRIVAQGNIVIIASGRPFNGVNKFLTQFPESDLKYAVCANGAEAYKQKTGDLIFKKGLKYRDFLYIMKKYWKQGEEIYTFSGNVLGSMAPGTPWISQEIEASNMTLRDYSEDPAKPGDYISKTIIASETTEDSAELEKRIDPIDRKKYAIMRSSPYFLEFVNKADDKSVPIKFIADRFAIPYDHVHTFGDAMNDYKMIRLFDGTAMGNAQLPVKQVAKRVAPPVWEDGVGQTLRNVFKVG